jgi:hypothetical protein
MLLQEPTVGGGVDSTVVGEGVGSIITEANDGLLLKEGVSLGTDVGLLGTDEGMLLKEGVSLRTDDGMLLKEGF